MDTTYARIKAGRYTWPAAAAVSENAAELVALMLQQDPADRPPVCCPSSQTPPVPRRALCAGSVSGGGLGGCMGL